MKDSKTATRFVQHDTTHEPLETFAAWFIRAGGLAQLLANRARARANEFDWRPFCGTGKNWVWQK